MKKKIKTLSAHRFLKVELVPQFRKFLNVWHIQNLEQPFLIWACNCLVKFWRSPKNFKIRKFLWKILNRLSNKNSPNFLCTFKKYGLKVPPPLLPSNVFEKSCLGLFVKDKILNKNCFFAQRPKVVKFFRYFF